MIQAQSTIDEATLSRAREWHWRSSIIGPLYPLKRLYPFLGAMGLLSSGYLWWKAETITPTLMLLVIAGIYLLFHKWISGVWFGIYIRKMPMYRKKLIWTLEEDRLKTDADGNTSNISWSAFYMTRITPEGILIYPQKRYFLWLPRSAFAYDFDFEQAVEIVKAKTKWKEIK